MTELLRILLITGEKSFSEIQKIADKVTKEKSLQIQCEVIKAPVDVSAFIQPSHVLSLVRDIEVNKYNFALLPGFTTWDTSEVSHKVNLPIYKGTRFSGDLFDLLVNIRDIELPTKKAADHLLKNRSKQKIEEQVELLTKIYSTKGQMESEPRVLRFITPCGERVLTGGKFPPLLVAEIVDSPNLDQIEIMEKVQYFISSGADVIDLGMIFGQSHPELIRNIIPKIKKKCDILVSIDSVQIEEIIAGIESGADIILSIDGTNIDDFLEYVETHPIKKDLGLVLVPLARPSHKEITNPEKKADYLISLAKKLTSKGFRNLMYDPLLKSPISPSLIDSLYAYYVLHAKLQSQPELYYPLFIGLHNVFELVDADSSGIITLLTLLAVELHSAGIFTTEFSPKTLGAIQETRRSIDLAYLARISKSPPTNLGLDSFYVKSKKKSFKRAEKPDIILDIYNDEIPNEILQKLIQKNSEFIHDTTGYFKFYVDHQSKLIEAFFIPFESTKMKLKITGPILIKGKTAESLYKTIDKLGLVKEISHAFYVGKELSKAEYSLHVNAAYFEDTELD